MQIVTSWMREGIEIGRREGFQEGRQEGRQEDLVEGHQEGLVEGRQEGQKQAAIAFVLRLLEYKFGPIAQEMCDRIERLPFEQLEALGEALLKFEEPEDLERWLEVVESEEAEKGGEPD